MGKTQTGQVVSGIYSSRELSLRRAYRSVRVPLLLLLP